MQDNERVPELSICITNYNYGRYLKELIPLILNQTYSDFELLIADNCSTDNSVEIIKSFSDPRISFFQNSQNIGMTGKWEKVRSLAREKYIWFINADDLVEGNNFLEEMMKCLKENNADIVFCKRKSFYFDIVNKEGKHFCTYEIPFLAKKKCEDYKTLLKRLYLYYPMIGQYILKKTDLKFNMNFQ